jgi:hypothetical protein
MAEAGKAYTADQCRAPLVRPLCRRAWRFANQLAPRCSEAAETSRPWKCAHVQRSQRKHFLVQTIRMLREKYRKSEKEPSRRRKRLVLLLKHLNLDRTTFGSLNWDVALEAILGETHPARTVADGADSHSISIPVVTDGLLARAKLNDEFVSVAPRLYQLALLRQLPRAIQCPARAR